MADWTEKYRPSTLSEVRGNNDKARDAFADWARSWDDHHEAVVLHGSPGVGKTSAAHARERHGVGDGRAERLRSAHRRRHRALRGAGRAQRHPRRGARRAAARPAATRPPASS